MKQTKFTGQTHFIGVLLPEDITNTLEDCRRYMKEAYGCRSGQATPVHVTLVPPFALPDSYSTEDLVNAIEKDVLPQEPGFTGRIENFASFGDRTLFAKVIASDLWTKIRDETVRAVMKACPGSVKKDNKPFQPHATVANRDIPEGTMTEAVKVMNDLDLVEEFPVDNITIFEKRGFHWETAVTLELKGAD